MNKFNILYNSILNNIIKESSSFKSSILDDSKYEFKKDDNMNIICTFTIERNGIKYIVNSSFVNEELSFNVVDESGNKRDLTEKEFATEYYLDYDDFKDAFDRFKEDQESIDSIDSGNGTNIKQFGDVLSAIGKKEGLNDEREYTIDGVSFVFRILKDQLVTNYCECLFQDVDKDTNELNYYKALIFLKKVNSVIIKIILFDEKGNMKSPMMGNDLLRENKELYGKLMKAIKKMGLYVANKD